MSGDNFEWEKNYALADEGLRTLDKKRYMSILSVLSIICALISIPIIVLVVLYQQGLQNDFFIGICIVSSFAILISIISFIWSRIHYTVEY